MSAKKSKVAKISILYLYDFDGWAIENVGKLWLEENPNLKVTYSKSTDFSYQDSFNYDIIWFGFLNLVVDHYWELFFHHVNLKKCIVSIHDPLELFPEVEDWKNLDINRRSGPYAYYNFKLSILKEFNSVVTASKEMQEILNRYGVEAKIIPTMSLLPSRSKTDIRTTKCSFLSVYELYGRKNPGLIELLKQFSITKLGVDFDTKVGKKILPIKDYIKLLDNHSVYICASFQEGGPLTAMDAMKRGEVVLTTPVGQIQDLITDGENGFICSSEKEFKKVLTKLNKNPILLKNMRLKSLLRIDKLRNKKEIQKAANTILESMNLSESFNQGSTNMLLKGIKYRLREIYIRKILKIK